MQSIKYKRTTTATKIYTIMKRKHKNLLVNVVKTEFTVKLIIYTRKAHTHTHTCKRKKKSQENEYFSTLSPLDRHSLKLCALHLNILN